MYSSCWLAMTLSWLSEHRNRTEPLLMLLFKHVLFNVWTSAYILVFILSAICTLSCCFLHADLNISYRYISLLYLW